MLAPWLEKWRDGRNFIIVNIDEGSTKNNLEFGNRECARLGIHFEKSNPPGMHNNILQASSVMRSMGVEWLLYSQHDAYPLVSNIEELLQARIESGRYEGFGVIGFNTHHNEEIALYSPKTFSYQTTARTVLEKGNGYYRNRRDARIKYPKDPGLMFAVESVHWTNALINIEMFRNFIDPDPFYFLFHSWDDIAFQFLKKDIYNVVDSSIPTAHEQSLKEKHGLPMNSPKNPSSEVQGHYFGRWGHLEHWESKWGFRWDVRKVIFDKYTCINYIYENYANASLRRIIERPISNCETLARFDIRTRLDGQLPSSLLQKFYEHDPKFGFLKTFE